MKAFLMARRVALLGVLILAACAGGGETGTGITQTGGSGKDVSVGTITAFGSVWVNGVEFETPSTQVTVEGAVSSTDALRLGMVVTVKGTINADKVSGIADAILVEVVMIGPVDTVAASTLTVLGQTVQVSAATKLDGLVLANLTRGSIVEVSGVIKGPGVIAATRIELKGPTDEYKLKGIVSEINTANKTFKIGTVLVVDYTGVIEFVPTNGMLVEVKGTASTPGMLTATELEAEKLDVEDADNFEMEGFVAGVSPIAGGMQFSVNNVTVQTSADTEFEGGLAIPLAGMYVEVEGLLVGGIVMATKIQLKDSVL